jgi:hypothetical protein
MSSVVEDIGIDEVGACISGYSKLISGQEKLNPQFCIIGIFFQTVILFK